MIRFEDWFYEIENYGMRAERFYDDVAFQESALKKQDVMVRWLRAAFAAGQAEMNQIKDYENDN